MRLLPLRLVTNGLKQEISFMQHTLRLSSRKEEPSLMQQAGDWLTGGQSAGQIAEQAGRGLVNIPFDVLQGGASLINAISQGLDPRFWMMFIVQSIDRQTLATQAGETIGRYSCQLAQGKSCWSASKARWRYRFRRKHDCRFSC